MRTVKNESQKQASKRINPLHMLLQLQNKEINYLEPRINTNEKRGRPRGLPLPSPSARLGAVHRSAAPWPPTGWPRSTLGAMGLSFRVRNGTGRAPHALAADRWAAPTVTVPGVSLTCPGGRMAHRKGDSGASSCPDRASAGSRGPRGAVPEELGRLVRLG